MAYCADGPYRHLRTLLDARPHTWFPWGYTKRRIEPNVDVRRGTEVEVWEVDDTRDPRKAEPVAICDVDFISETADYLALTLRTHPGRVEANQQSVVSRVRVGLFVFDASSEASHDGAARATSCVSG